MKKTNTIHQKIVFFMCFIGFGLTGSLLSMSQPLADQAKDEALAPKKKVQIKTPTMIFIQKTTKRRPYAPLFNSIAPERQRKLKSLDDVALTSCEEDMYPDELISIPFMPTPVLGKAPISDIRHSASCDSSLAAISQQRIDQNHAELGARLKRVSGLVVRQRVVKPIVQTPEETLKILFKYVS